MLEKNMTTVTCGQHDFTAEVDNNVGRKSKAYILRVAGKSTDNKIVDVQEGKCPTCGQPLSISDNATYF